MWSIVKPAYCPGKGRGLLAVQNILAGELIDSAPTIQLSSRDCEFLEMTALGDFYFAHPSDGEAGLVVLGLASLCNYSESPNANVLWRHDERIGWIAELVALCAIDAGEEVTYCYRCAPWFQVKSEDCRGTSSFDTARKPSREYGANRGVQE